MDRATAGPVRLPHRPGTLTSLTHAQRVHRVDKRSACACAALFPMHRARTRWLKRPGGSMTGVFGVSELLVLAADADPRQFGRVVRRRSQQAVPGTVPYVHVCTYVCMYVCARAYGRVAT
jgi:hypothetical protein